MHIIFTEEEMKWVKTKEFGWPIKDGCPKQIRESIKKKMRILGKQMQNGNAIG